MDEQINEQDELKSCASSFEYFSKNYLKLQHPAKGLIPLNLHNFQKRYVNHIEDNRFTIAKKFRQGGFTTTTLAWFLWRFLFKLDERNMILCRTDRFTVECNYMVTEFIKYLPEFLTPKLSRRNDHLLEDKEIGNKLHFHTPTACCGLAIHNLFIDEAALFSDMERSWTDLWPCVSCGGKVIVASSPNGKQGWFYENYTAAEKLENKFSIFRSHHLEHPEYQNGKWTVRMKELLGEKGFRSEVLAEFI